MTDFPDSSLLREAFKNNRGIAEYDLHYMYGQRRSDLASYNRTFKSLLGQSSVEGLVSKLASQNKSSGTPPLVIDLFAPTDTLTDLQEKLRLQGVEIQGAAVSLEYYPTEDKPIYHDLGHTGISHVQGDLCRASTWINLENATNGQRADLIIERALAGIDTLPWASVFTYGALNRVWNKLRPGGVFIGQTPTDSTLARAGLPTISQLTHYWNMHGIESDIDAVTDPNYPVLMLRKSDERNVPVPTSDSEL